MKKSFFIKSLYLILFLTVPFLRSQTFTLTIQNQTILGNEIHFDIYLLNTGTTDIYLGNSSFVFTFNSANFDNPVYIGDQMGAPGSRLRNNYGYSLSVISSNEATLTITPPAIGNQGDFNQEIEVVSNSGFGTLIVNAKITGISNDLGTSDFQWRTSEPNKTIIRSLETSSPWDSIDISSGGTYTNPPSVLLPVELNSFNAQTINTGIKLLWQTSSEVNNYGFEVQRRYPRQAGDWIKLGFVQGYGNSNTPKSYSFMDNTLTIPGKYLYRLKQVDNGGNFEYSQITEAEYNPPLKYGLAQNYPNPFNPSTKISFAVPKISYVSVKVYNVLGNQTALLFNGTAQSGKTYDLLFDGSSLASGIYYCVFESGGKTEVKKMILLR
ncbi:MAG: T9SS type A sorting domain-containing protein [Ignavibacteria bacterium]